MWRFRWPELNWIKVTLQCLHFPNCCVFLSISSSVYFPESVILYAKRLLLRRRYWFAVVKKLHFLSYCFAAKLTCCARSFKIPPTVLQGGRRQGLMEPLPRFIDLLRYFETISPLVEILWSSQQDEVYFMVGSAAGGLWRHQQWMPSWILPRIRNQVKIAIDGNFFVLDM